jgi:hypothetical protein
MFVLLIASILSVTARALNFEPAGRAVSIMSLALSVPHSLFLRDHSRSLDFLQTSYLVLNCSSKSYEKALDYSVISFVPSFIKKGEEYFGLAGGYLSFLLILMGVLTLTFIVYKIERLFGSRMTFTEPWLVLRSLIDWVYLVLFRFTSKCFIQIIIHGSEIGSSVAEFIVMCLVFVFYATYHILLMSVDMGLSEKPTLEELAIQRRRRLVEMATYFKAILLSLLLAFSEEFGVSVILYGFIPVLVIYLATYVLWYEFVGASEKVLFILSQCAMTCNVGLILNDQNPEIVHICIIVIFVG